MRRVLLSGYYGFDNSGDDAILRAIVKDLREQDQDISIVVLSNNPRKTEEIYRVKAVNRFSLRDIVREIRATDLFISGGGSLLQDITSNRSLWYYLMTMQLAIFFKKPFMVYANGIGPINNRINRRLTRHILNKADFITLRDEDSRAFVQELGVKNKNILVTSDPVFTLEASSRTRVEEIFSQEGIPRDRKLIGISIRPWENDQGLMEALKELIDFIGKNYDVNIVLIPMHHPEDLEMSEELLGLGDFVYVLRQQYSVEDIMGLIRELELILAMRLHALIYAASQRVPIVGLIYDPKLSGLIKILEIENYLDVQSIRGQDLIGEFRKVWEKRQEISEALALHEARQEEMARKNISIVYRLLDKK